MSTSAQRQAEALVATCRRQGLRVRETRNGWTIYPTDKALPTVGLHKTSSDHRWYKNAVASLRRIGVEI